jgi:transposase
LARGKKINLSQAAIDGSLIPSFSFGEETGYSGKHHRTGTKVVVVTDADGVPLSLVIAPGNRHDYPLATLAVRRVKVGQQTRPAVLLGDKGFDGTSCRRNLRRRGIKTNIPERQFRKRRKRGRPPRYDKELGKKRYVVERTNGWLKSFRRLRFRYDYTVASFRGLLLLACIVIGVRRLTS